MHPKDLSIKDFTYDLPDEKIAYYPVEQRDSSKLLIYKEGSISETLYNSIDEFLPADSTLFFNNTKVIPARLLFRKSTGGLIEIFCLEPEDQLPEKSLQSLSPVTWKCFVGGAAKWKEEQIIIPLVGDTLVAEKLERAGEVFIIRFSWMSDKKFIDIITEAGNIPLPPYIKRHVESEDVDRYQTIFAKHEGSVAAPTASLHFTDHVMKKIHSRQIKTDFITLHVGAGTFKPVKADVMSEHDMHAEWIDVSKETIQNILSSKCTVAVGTTSLRTLESLYWIGVKLKDGEEITLSQWECYELRQDITLQTSLGSVLDYMSFNNMTSLVTTTQIIIAPGYKFRVADILITNFHQPQSTLLLLVAAAIGNYWKQVYEYALSHDYRFLSYGDGSMLYIDKAQTID